MNRNDFFQLISEGNTFRAVEYLNTRIVVLNNDHKLNAIALCGQYNRLRDEIIKGVLSSEEERVRTNKINDQLSKIVSKGQLDRIFGVEGEVADYIELSGSRFNEKVLHVQKANKNVRLMDVFVHPRIKINENIFDNKDSFVSYVKKWLSEEDSLKHLVLLGGGGVGKSMYLEYLNSYLSNNYEELLFVPIFINLNELLAFPNDDLISFIRVYIVQKTTLSYARFTELASKGKLVFLLDAFDELLPRYNFKDADDFFSELRILLEKFPNNKVVISGRDTFFKSEKDRYQILKSDPNRIVYNSYIPYFEEVHFLGLTKGQIKKYCNSFFGKDNIEAKLNFDWIINNEDIYSIAKQPFYLAIICSTIYSLKEIRNIEEQGVEFKILDVYIEQWFDWQLSKKNSPLISKMKRHKEKELYVSIFTTISLRMYESSKLKNEELKNKKYLPMLSSLEVKNIIYNRLKREEEISQETRNLVVEDIMKNYFIDISSDVSKFFHYTIVEYFVSREIINSIHLKDHKRPAVANFEWSNSVIEMVKPQIEYNLREFEVPKLLRLKYDEDKSKSRLKYFKKIGNLAVLSVQFFIPIIRHSIIIILVFLCMYLLYPNLLVLILAILLFVGSLYVLTKKQCVHNLIFRYVVGEKRKKYNFIIKALRYGFQTGSLDKHNDRSLFERLFVTYSFSNDVRNYKFKSINIFKHNLIDMYFEDVVFQGGCFFVGNVYDCTFENVIFKNFKFDLVSFENCHFRNCDFSSISHSKLSILQLKLIRIFLRFAGFTFLSDLPQYYLLDFTRCNRSNFDDYSISSLRKVISDSPKILSLIKFNGEMAADLD